ncbi:glycosyltransferase [Rhodobacter sp. Har01]|uniref:glycosyltransferase n=1 Tax=Rhodobacter sp. Har01 TaxID=2883999 RepID=UPI001D067204|nr:glycosyltransferase [Rhodobacter sp. Har01]MCB6178376.1 glycosyltransferase [Rhodobacter sp. Har01]
MHVALDLFEDLALPKASVLLAVRNGARHLPQQLASVYAQQGVSVRVYASDDGSTDGSRTWLQAHTALRGAALRLTEGPRQGAAAAFLALLSQAPLAAEITALCDQDDVWLPRKLRRAQAALANLPAGQPGVVVGARLFTDADLRPQGRDAAWRRHPGFANALVENILPGNAMVMNAAALAIVRASLPAAQAAQVPLHDWWIYLVLSGAGATFIRDPEPMVLYRQHDGNQIGRNDGPLARAAGMVRALGGRYRDRVDANLRGLRACQHLLTPKNRRLLQDFLALRRSPLRHRLTQMARLGLYRQGRLSQAALHLGLALGKA